MVFYSLFITYFSNAFDEPFFTVLPPLPRFFELARTEEMVPVRNSILICLPLQKTGWNLPMTTRREGETMRAAAERAILENCGEAVEFRVLGNAPWAYYKRPYPKRIQQELGHNGEKVRVFLVLLELCFHFFPLIF